jgi:hypothetical protein
LARIFKYLEKIPSTENVLQKYFLPHPVGKAELRDTCIIDDEYKGAECWTT